MSDYGEVCARDRRTTLELVSVCLSDSEADDSHHAVAVMHYRGGREEFDIAVSLSRSACEIERTLSADILGQLGWGGRTWLEESVTVLIELLCDPCDDVIHAAAIALGYRNHPRAIRPLIATSRHSNPIVRYGVVHGLSGHDDLLAVGALVELSRDSDPLVRDWATFGIGQQTSLDSTEIRDVLLERTEDDDPVVRGEALMGLAQRQDSRVVRLIHRELSGEFHGSWAVEAAELMADASLYASLVSLRERLDEEDRERFECNLRAALLACGPRP